VRTLVGTTVSMVLLSGCAAVDVPVQSPPVALVNPAGQKFESAGGHWNPAGRHHGLSNPQGPHAGDLPNVTVSSSGSLSATLVAAHASFSDLADADGSALVIHAAADDYMTDPSGNSGARIACAVLAPPR